MIDFEPIKAIIENNLASKTEAFQRLFHGRGHCYKGFEFLTIDSIDRLLHVAYFAEIDEALHHQIYSYLDVLFRAKKYDTIILQRRYLNKAPTEILFGKLPEITYAYENQLRYLLTPLENQNNGFFGDMKVGRKFVQAHAKNRRVLNLFSYTCAFSVAAIAGGATKVVNVDMSKSVLNRGRQNHHSNNQDTHAVHFMPYNILKSWSRIRKAGPYDIIIIDPPSFQKGSFASTTDYQKIIRRLKELSSDACIVLAALNNPQLNSQFIKDIFAENAPEFRFVQRLENAESYPTKEIERSLKNLIFTNTTH